MRTYPEKKLKDKNDDRDIISLHHQLTQVKTISEGMKETLPWINFREET